MRVQLKSVMFCRRQPRVCRQGGGKIIHIARATFRRLYRPYTAACTAFGNYASLSNEFAALNININAIAPATLLPI